MKVSCACGQAFVAPESMRGKSARCPKCKGTISIPGADPGGDLLGVDPLMMADPFSAAASSPLADPLAARPQQQAAPTKPAAAAANQPPWLLIGLGGGAAVVVLIVVVAVVLSSMGGNDVAQVPSPGPLPTTGTGGPSAPASPSAPPAPQPGTAASNPSSSPAATGVNAATPGQNTPAASNPPPSSTATSGTATSGNSGGNTASAGEATPSSAGPGSSSAPAGVAPAGAKGIGLLPTAIHSWHNDDRFRRRGVIRVGSAETHYGHYSWMTQLLPFLGHQKEYDQLNLKEGLFDGNNIEVGAIVIPEFLNPLDDRKVWKGYPLQGLALTHFVGMSGVEDARNVVAATLPRSDPRAGVFGYDEVATAAEITDGTSQTIMVIGSGTMANPWIMGGGGTVRGAREPYFDKVSGFGSRNLPQAGALTLMADGSVRLIPATVDPTVFRSLCTIHGAETVDLERAAAPFVLNSIAK